jgi:DNA-binding transcriptional LysR family regulator
MDLTQIRYFLTLARTLNFTRAAEACNVTQPALTKSIQRLEDELGGPLILRERALSQLTELGRAMLPMLEQAYTAAERAKEHASGLRKQSSSPLRVGFAPEVAALPFMSIFTELAAKLPGFELSLTAGSNLELCEGLLHGALDVAVVGSPVTLPERLNRGALFSDSMRAVMRADHAAAQAERLVPEHLRNAEVVLRWHGCAMTRLLDRAAGEHGIRPAARHLGTTADQAAEMVRAGFGIMLLPAMAQVPPDLVGRPVDGVPPHEVMLLAVAGRPYGRAAATFMKAARARSWVEAADLVA